MKVGDKIYINLEDMNVLSTRSFIEGVVVDIFEAGTLLSREQVEKYYNMDQDKYDTEYLEKKFNVVREVRIDKIMVKNERGNIFMIPITEAVRNAIKILEE